MVLASMQRLALDFQGTALDGGWVKTQCLLLVADKAKPTQPEVDRSCPYRATETMFLGCEIDKYLLSLGFQILLCFGPPRISLTFFFILTFAFKNTFIMFYLTFPSVLQGKCFQITIRLQIVEVNNVIRGVQEFFIAVFNEVTILFGIYLEISLERHEEIALKS